MGLSPVVIHVTLDFFIPLFTHEAQVKKSGFALNLMLLLHVVFLMPISKPAAHWIKKLLLEKHQFFWSVLCSF